MEAINMARTISDEDVAGVSYLMLLTESIELADFLAVQLQTRALRQLGQVMPSGMTGITLEPQVSPLDLGDPHNGREGLLLVSCPPRRCVIEKRLFFHASVIERAVSQVKAFAYLYGPHRGTSGVERIMSWDVWCMSSLLHGSKRGLRVLLDQSTLELHDALPYQPVLFLWRHRQKIKGPDNVRHLLMHLLDLSLSVMPLPRVLYVLESLAHRFDPGWRNLAAMARRHGALRPCDLAIKVLMQIEGIQTHLLDFAVYTEVVYQPVTFSMFANKRHVNANLPRGTLATQAT
jgi:hypothetical protein